MCEFAAVALWVYLDSSYCLIQNCAWVHATGWVPMAESSCTWTKAGWHKVKTPQRLSSMSVFAAVALWVYPSSIMEQPSDPHYTPEPPICTKTTLRLGQGIASGGVPA